MCNRYVHDVCMLYGVVDPVPTTQTDGPGLSLLMSAARLVVCVGCEHRQCDDHCVCHLCCGVCDGESSTE